MARIVFLGTPQFGVPTLEKLAQHHQVVAIVTQPDRAAGRGRGELSVPPVKRVAEAYGIPVLQPRRLRRAAQALQALRASAADLFVLASYGQILSPEVLAIPKRGCLGIHASLLPKYRGAAPIPAAILHGETETGISIMLTDEGMDTGAVLAQRSLAIAPEDTTATLSERLAQLGADLVIEVIPRWLAREVSAQPQDETLATYAPPIDKAAGLIDWRLSAAELDRHRRAYTPWPGVYTMYKGQMLKILHASPHANHVLQATPGTVVALDGGIGVATGQGVLQLEVIQLAGKKATPVAEFARGQRGFIGSILGV